MRILLIGLGSIGRRHLDNILSAYPDAEIILLRHPPPLKSENIFGICDIFYNLDDAIKAKPDVAFLTCPSPLHIPIAIELANQNIHLFIEKPLSHDLKNVDVFLDICKRNNIVVMIGYNFRFYKPLQCMKDAINSGLIGKVLSYRAEVGQYLPDWRVNSDYRHCVSAKKELGGGALLELSHEIDYARWLLGEADVVSAISGKFSDLEMDVEDVAEINLYFKSGCVGNIHLDMINRAKTRTCQIIGSTGTLFWDNSDNSVKVFLEDSSGWSYLSPPQNIDRNQMYIDEISHFFDCVREGRTPSVSVKDGVAVLNIVSAVRESSSRKRCIKV